MQISTFYSGGRTYGTGENPKRYAAKVGSDQESVNLGVRFPCFVKGMGANTDLAGSVEGFSLSMSRDDAMRIGMMLVSAAQQPENWWKEDSRWMPPELMPSLETADWVNDVAIECLGYVLDYKVINRSEFHLGFLSLKCAYTTTDGANESHHTVDLLVDLPPGQSRQVTIQSEIFPISADRITNVSIVAVSGFDLTILWRD